MISNQEEWRNVVGFAGFYLVSSMGRVKSIRTRTILRASGNPYPRVGLPGRRKVRVHTLVLEAFVGPRPQLKEACHNNGDRHDNRLSNLRWGSDKENQADRLKHGTSARYGNNAAATTSLETVVAIKRALLKETRRGIQRELAAQYGVSEKVVHTIKTGSRWGYVQC